MQEYNVDYVLVGGVALNLHGIIRATENIDLFILAEPSSIDRLKNALRSLWKDPDIDLITAEELSGEYPTIRYGPPGEDFVIDLLSRLGTTFRFEDLQAEVIYIEGIAVRLATPKTLYRMKKDTLRVIDRADSEMLKEKFSLEDELDAHPEI